MAKKNSFLLFFFIFLSTFSLIKLFENLKNLDAWEYGEWLINYQAGFIRRGLPGEIIFQFSSLLGNNIQLSFFIILSTICLLYYYLNYLFLKNIKLSFFNLFIIFSPLFYLFFVMINGVGIRKEILLYLFYLAYLINLSSKNFNINKIWKFLYIFPLILFAHEAMFFYLPYVLLPLLFVIKKNDYKNLIFHSLTLIIICLFVMLIMYINKGTNEHVVSICKSLSLFAPVKCESFGPIYALKDELMRDQNFESIKFFYLDAKFSTWIGFLFYLFYSFFPILIFFYSIKLKEKIIKNRYIFLLILLTFFVFGLPLLHIAMDWSRFFSIHLHLVAFFVFFLQRINIVDYKKSGFFIKLNNFFTLNKKICFLFLLIYSTFLYHEEYFSKDVKLELMYKKIYQNINKKI